VNKHLLLIIFFLSITGTFLGAQDSIAPNPNKFKIIGVPIVFFTPDTKWSGGAGGVTTFNFPADSLRARRSTVTIGLAYTQLRQLLIYFPFQLFPKNQKYWISGEVGYYRYVFNFFGVGNGIPNEYIEKYDANFPRIRANFSKKVSPGLYLGLRYAFDNFDLTPRNPDGLLTKGRTPGAEGGTVSGVGIGANYDTRNSLFYPSRGWLGETTIYTENNWTGSDFQYTRLSADVSRYVSWGKQNIIAINGATVFSFGNVPYHQMPVIGGTKRLRGYFEGKFRDKHLLVLQTEYRRMLFWRIGVAAFGGLGMVGTNFNDLQIANTKYHYGAGLRVVLDKAQKINIRADFGIGQQSTGFYLTFGEAF